MDINTLRSLVTVAGFVVFVAILVWAYRPARKESFEEAARLPFGKPYAQTAAKPDGSQA